MAIVLELQKESLGKHVPITDLLRKALLVARKLNVEEFETWIQKELNGYGDAPKSEEIPKYRHLKGSPQILNPYHGWQRITFPDPKAAEAFSHRVSPQPIAEIEHMIVNSNHHDFFEIPYSGAVEIELIKAMGIDARPTLHIYPATLNNIIDAVRNIVLSWALKLEKDGILGSEISFTEEEIKAAERAHYTINTFNGDVVNSQVQQGTTGSAQKRKESQVEH